MEFISFYAVRVVSWYQSNPRLDHLVAMKHILKYLRRTRSSMLVYSSRDLISIRYTNSDFQLDKDSHKSTSRSIFTFGDGAIVWRSIKQSCIADSTMKAKYVVACQVAKAEVWLQKFLTNLKVFRDMDKPLTLYFNKSEAMENSKKPISHKRGNHIARKYHLIREIVWLQKSSTELEVVRDMDKPLTLYFDNNRAMTNSKELRATREECI